MQFISESLIDQQANHIGEADDLSPSVERLKTRQPAIFAYLFSEGFNLLTEKEKEYLLFLTLVIFESILQIHPEQKNISDKIIEDLEESNWEILNDSKARSFREKLDPFFEQTNQEDLLAFVEDAVVYDEDELITKEGADHIFIGLKTIIDSLERAVMEN